MHKAGFVNIIGKPNVGKSSLFNALSNEKMAIVTPKAQTTRHRIFSILNDDDFQLILSDSPGIIEPKYKLQETMMQFAMQSFDDADVLLVMSDVRAGIDLPNHVIELIKKCNEKVIVILNKIDLCDALTLEKSINEWKQTLGDKIEIIPFSTKDKTLTDALLSKIKNLLPEAPPYYDKDQISDKPERFFVNETVREKIFLNYNDEIPYSVEVQTDSFKESDDIIRIMAYIYCLKDSQKNIIIGKGGSGIKKVGTEARKDLEVFFNKKIYLELFVKVKENWKNDESQLKRFGYNF